MAPKPDDKIIDMVLEYDRIGTPDAVDDHPDYDDIDDEILSDVVSQLRADVDAAVNMMADNFETDREKAQKYYSGKSDLPVAGENRSKYVHTKVRDTIRAIKPDIMRVLVGSPWPVEFVPPTMEQAPLAEIQTRYVTQLFHRLGGYKVIYDVSHTACLHKLGVAKVFYAEKKVPQYASYTGIDAEQLRMLQEDPDVTVIIDSETEIELPAPDVPLVPETPPAPPPTPGAPPMPGAPPQPPQPPQPQTATVYDVDVISFIQKGRTCMQSIPPEDFIIDEWATNDEDFRVIGHRRNVSISDAVAMGFDKEAVEDLDAQDPEVYDAVGLSEKRRGYQISANNATSQDESQNLFLLTEVYYHADLDGLGVAQLYRFWLGGTSYRYLDHERVDDHPFALFSIDPEPFTVFGKSIYDLTHNDQDVETSLMRAIVDNAHISNNPRLAVHETLVNMEDVLNNEIGAPIRNRGAGQIQVIGVPFTGGNLMPVMQYLDEATDNKTGVTRASVGLDPSALQSTDKQAVQNTIAKQAGQIELAVRNLAETGMTRLFRLLLKTTLENPNPVQTIKLAGAYVPAPLGSFDPEMDMEVCVGTGTASHDQKIMALQQVKAEQDKIMQMMGPGNPVVSLRQMFNTVQDGLELVGMKNIQRYFTPVTPEIEAQVAKQMADAAAAAQQQPQQPDPTQGIVEAEKIKAQTKMQTDGQKNQLDMMKAAQQQDFEMTRLRAEMGYRVAEATRKDDLERDKLIQDLYVKLAAIEADQATRINAAQIGADVQMKQAANDRRGPA